MCGFQWIVLTAIGWIAMEFDTGIHVPLWMNCSNFGNPLKGNSTSLSVCIQVLWSTSAYVQKVV